MSNRFRNDQNTRLLEALFFERAMRPGVNRKYVLYTLKDLEHNGFPSLYQLYLETADPTEHYFAAKYFENYDHWRMLTESNWFKPHLSRWRNELEIKIRAQALEAIRKVAEDPLDKNSFQANKFLISKGWKDVETTKTNVGRPTKEAIKKEAEILQQESNSVEDDFKRLMSVETQPKLN